MGERFGNYEILRKLAAGGMAEVFLAKQQGLAGFERLVCLKRILPHLSGQEEFLKMFQDEARIAANLVHPNIAQIYDIGVQDEHYYIAMEYVRGEDLRRVYNQEVTLGQTIAEPIAANIVRGAAAGLAYAHRQTALDGSPLGIVHRDISPQNILVTYDGHVKLIDFGVAKAAGKLNQTRAGVLKGKYSYMSPEQAAGDPVDGRTDIFALGITLYEITCGTRLFKRDNELETLHAVIACNVPKPSDVMPGYAPALERIVLRALAYDASARYASAAELEAELERYLQEEGHPSSASALAGYMQALFAAKLQDDAAGADAGALAKTALSAAGAARAPHGRSRRGQDARQEREAGASDTDLPTRVAKETATVPGNAWADDEATTVDAADARSGRPTDPPAAAAVQAAGNNDWRLEENNEQTGSALALPEEAGAASVTFLPAQQAQALEQAAALAWDHEKAELRAAAPAQPPGASAPPTPAGGRARQRRRRWALAACLVGFFGLASTLARRQLGGPLKDGLLPPPGDLAVVSLPANELPADGNVAGHNPPEASEGAPRPIPRDLAGLDVTAPLPMTVTLGGHLLGETPLFGVAVTPGTLHLKLENRQEGLTLWRRVVLPKNESRQLHVAPGPKGRLRIEATPWAWVQRGLYPAAETPQESLLVPGDYQVVMECQDGRRREQLVHVHGGEATRLHLDCRLGEQAPP